MPVAGSRAVPGFLLLHSANRRRLLTAGAGALALSALGCTPRFNWREVRPEAARCVIALPDKPQSAERELDLAGDKVTMRMTSTGVGPTLFALGVAELPPAALAPERMEATLAWFRDGLLRNVQGTLTATRALTLSAPAGRTVRSAQAVSATGRIGDGRKAVLAARFYVVDDRLYQVVALGAEGEIPAEALDTFFDSFRLTE
jgi:hypothetical protein